MKPWRTPLTGADTIARQCQVQQLVTPRRTLNTTKSLVRKPWGLKSDRWLPATKAASIEFDCLE